MCLVSDKIKFCTCADVEDLEALDSYWMLHQPNADSDEIMIGTCVEPTAVTDPNFELNESVILQRLNEGHAFDKPFKFKKKDRLEVVVNLDNESGSFSYNFEYSGRKWKAVAEDIFELMSHYKQYKQGTINKERK